MVGVIGRRYQIPTMSQTHRNEQPLSIDISSFFKALSAPKPLPGFDEPIESLDSWLHESQENHRNSEGVTKLLLALMETLDAHMIEHFIEYFENMSGTRPRQIHQWPVAEIEYKFGQRQIKPLSAGNLIELIGAVVQGGVTVFAEMLYRLTYSDISGVGIIGVRYVRDNSIIYTDQYQTQQFIQALQQVTSLLQEPTFQQSILQLAERISGSLNLPTNTSQHSSIGRSRYGFMPPQTSRETSIIESLLSDELEPVTSNPNPDSP